MSERREKLKQNESSVAGRQKTEDTGEHRADFPRRTAPAGLTALTNRLWQVGNRAINWLLGKQGGGQPLAQQTRAEMERSFDADFSDVRIHQDSSAQAAAESLDATAFTRSDDIYLGSLAPAPDSQAGRALIAHELAHVTQQRQARAVTNEVSVPGDRFEQTADRASRQAMQGRQAEVAGSGAPPAIQRQQKLENRPSREEAQAALESWLRRVVRQQGGSKLRVTQEVKTAVTSLFYGDIGRLIRVDAWLMGAALPDDPADFAREVARLLPETIDQKRIEALNQMSGLAPAPSRIGRLGELIKKTAPGEPERFEPLREPTSGERFEQGVKGIRKQQGLSEPKEVSPVSVDVSRIVRIVKGLPEAWRGPGTKTTTPEAHIYPEVESAIEGLSPDSLIPAEARGTKAAGNFADAQELARDLARRLDVAQQQGQESVQIRLDHNYNGVRDRSAMIAEVNRIIQLIRDALPHHAAKVKFVDVFFGEKWVTRGMARRIP